MNSERYLCSFRAISSTLNKLKVEYSIIDNCIDMLCMSKIDNTFPSIKNRYIDKHLYIKDTDESTIIISINTNETAQIARKNKKRIDHYCIVTMNGKLSGTVCNAITKKKSSVFIGNVNIDIGNINQKNTPAVSCYDSKNCCVFCGILIKDKQGCLKNGKHKICNICISTFVSDNNSVIFDFISSHISRDIETFLASRIKSEVILKSVNNGTSNRNTIKLLNNSMLFCAL